MGDEGQGESRRPSRGRRKGSISEDQEGTEVEQWAGIGGRQEVPRPTGAEGKYLKGRIKSVEHKAGGDS